MDIDFSEALCYLISGKGNNFYARTLYALQTREARDRDGIPMMGVMLVERLLVLLYNVAWMLKAEFQDVVATIEHEGLHVILEHVPRKLTLAATFQTPQDKESFRRVTHWAEDMATNCLLFGSNEYMRDHLTEWIVPEQEPFRLPRGLTYEQYVSLLMDRDQQSEQSGVAKAAGKSDGGDGGKFHEFLKSQAPGGSEVGSYPQLMAHFAADAATDNLSDEEKQGLADELKHKIQNAVKIAMEEHTKSRGTLPGFLQELIGKLLTPPKIPWIRVLRDHVITTRRWKWRRSFRRASRRTVGLAIECPNNYLALPSKSRERTFTVVFCLDTSGSMNSNELEVALNELEHLRKADSDIQVTIIESDAGIGKEYQISARQPVEWSLSGRGGTSFDPALARARELKPDLVIYYTDGEAPAPALHNRVPCPMIWLLTPNAKTPDPDWGHVIEMQDK